MEIKKTIPADLGQKRGLFLVIGLAVSLGATLTAFEWKTYDVGDLMNLGSVVEDFDELVEVPPTIHPPKKPPVVQQPKLIEIPDDEEILEEIDVVIDVDITEEQIIEDLIIEDEMPEEKAEEIFVYVEEQASFPGGAKAWGKFLNKNFKYPRSAARMGIEGKVNLSFVVDKNGVISDIQVTRGIGGGCDEEAIRVLSQSPKWNPGKQRGNAVKSRMAIQIKFQLR
ncbi:MAG: TonB family protein [Roseivirga sp.]|nr:TonB family protein [Roseivirga sp.]